MPTRAPDHPRDLPPLTLALAVWGLAAALYLIGFFHRVAPAVITRELSADFGLGAAALGNLSAFYFYSYVAMQVPTGALADKWGPRRVLAAGALLASAGAMLFGGSAHYALACLGRLLIGCGVGVAFVCMLKLSSHWFQPVRFAMLSGFSLLCGVIGAVSAGPPLRLLVDAYGWRASLGSMGALTLLLCVAIWVVVRDDPSERGYRGHIAPGEGGDGSHSMLRGVAQVLAIPNVRRIAFVSGGVCAPALTFGGLWGVPFLTTEYGLSTAAASTITSLVLVAWAVPGPLAGMLSDRLKLRKPVYATAPLAATACWMIVFLVPGLPLALLVAVLLAAGVASAFVMIGFAFAKESAPLRLSGTAIGVINMGQMSGVMLMQPAVGWVLDRLWDGTLENGVRVYSFAAWRAGFGLMLVWLVAACIVVLGTRETRCRQRIEG